MSDSCNSMNCSLSGSSVHGILQARILEWVAISYSRGTSWPRNWTQVSHIARRCFTNWATKEYMMVNHDANDSVGVQTWAKHVPLSPLAGHLSWVISHHYGCIESYKFFLCSSSPAAAAAKLLQSCPTLCDPIEGSPPGSPIPGVLQARTLEWVAISFSNAWKWKVKGKSLSRVPLFVTPWTAAYQAPPSMGFSRQEYWSGVPLPSPFSSPNTELITHAFLSLSQCFPSDWQSNVPSPNMSSPRACE